MNEREPEIRISRPTLPFDREILDKLGEEIGGCPDVAFAHLCEVEVVERGEGPGPVLFVWLVSRAVRSLKPALNLVSGEYFIDDDPGHGNGTSFSVPSDTLSELDVVADLTGLPDGFHIFFVRTLDANGNGRLAYSLPCTKQ